MEAVAEEKLLETVDRIVEAVRPQRVFLDGSHAYGRPTRDSDIDLLIVVHGGDKPTWEITCDAYRALRGSQIPVEVKVVTTTRFEEQKNWRSSVERAAAEKGRLLYGCVD